MFSVGKEVERFLLRAGKNRIAVLLGLSFFLCLSFSSAATTLADASLVYLSSGEDIVYIKPNTATACYLFFELEGAINTKEFTIDYAQLDLSKAPSTMTATMGPSMCVSGGGRLTCKVNKNLVLNAGPEQSSVAIKIRVTEQDDSVTELERSFSFTVDGTRPTVQSIRPTTCYQDKCFVKQGFNDIVIELKDMTGTFDNRRVYFKAGSIPAVVSSCQGMTCEGRISITCNNGDLVTLAVDPRTSDDAGNRVTGPLSGTATCDTQAPTVMPERSISVASGRPLTVAGAQRPILAIGDEATVMFNVTERISPLVSGTLDLSPFGPGVEDAKVTCELLNQAQGLWACKVGFGVTAEAPLEDVKLVLSVSDLSGNTNQGAVINVDTKMPGNETPNDWRANDPREIAANKHYMQYTSKELFFPVQLTAKSGGARIIDARVPVQDAICKPVKKAGANATGQLDDLRVSILSFGPTQVFFTGWLNMDSEGHYDQLSKATYECGVEVLTIRGNYIGNGYERERFNVTFAFHYDGTMGEMVQAEIEQELNESERAIQNLEEIQNKLEFLTASCSTFGAIRGTSGGMHGAAAVLRLVPGMQGVANPISGVAKGLTKITELGGLSETITKLCSLLSCSTSITGLLLDKAGVDAERDFIRLGDNAGVSVNDMLSSIDPYDSYVGAVLNLCGPAVIYHLDRFQGIRCSYVACLSQGISEGTTSIEECQSMQNFAQCEFMMSGLTNAIPFSSLIQNTLNGLLEMASDPITLFGAGGLSFVCWGVQKLDFTGVAYDICLAQKGISAMVGATNTYKQALDQWKKSSSGDFGGDVCQAVRQNIDEANMYWNYNDNPAQRMADLHDDGNIDNGNAGYFCDFNTGCTFYLPDQSRPTSNTQSSTTAVTFKPGRGESFNMYIDGVRDLAIPYTTTTIKNEGKPDTYTYDVVRQYGANDPVGRALENAGLASRDNAGNYILNDAAATQLNDARGKTSEFKNNMMALLGQNGDEKYEDIYDEYEYNLEQQRLLSVDINQNDFQIATMNNYENLFNRMDNNMNARDKLENMATARNNIYEQAARTLQNEFNTELARSQPNLQRLHAILYAAGYSEEEVNQAMPDLSYDETFSLTIKPEKIQSSSFSISEAQTRFSTADLKGLTTIIGRVGNIQTQYGEATQSLNDAITNANNLIDLSASYEGVTATQILILKQALSALKGEDGTIDWDQVTPAQLDDLKKAANEVANEVKKAERQARRENREKMNNLAQELEAKAYAGEYYNNFFRTWQTIGRFGGEFKQVTTGIHKLLGGENEQGMTWGNHGDNWFNENLDIVRDKINNGQLSERMCRTALGKREQSVILNTGVGEAVQNAAHVEGIRMDNDYSGRNFTYKINVYVANGLENKNLSFSLILKGDNNLRRTVPLPDPFFNRGITDQAIVPPMKAYTKTKDSFVEHHDFREYDEVCLRFHVRRLNDWFDAARNQPNNEFCRELAWG